MLKNKKILGLFVMLLLLLSLTSCKKGERVIKDFPHVVSELESYRITGKLYSMFPTGTKECIITVYYKNADKYRVEVDNASLNDKQVVIKNSEGVHVLIPSLNKSFKVKSSWPLNSSYPYLLQSLSKDLLSDENAIKTNDGDTSSIEIKAKVFENANPSTQKIIFDNKTGYPNEVLVYDENHNLLSRFVFETIEINKDVDDNLFKVEETIANMREYYQEIVESYVRTVTYPTYYPDGTKLKEELITGTELKTAIMKFEGPHNFTIVEQYLSNEERLVTTYVDGDIYIMGGIVALVKANTICFGEQGVEYTIASTTLKPLEMIKMGDSLLVGSEK